MNFSKWNLNIGRNIIQLNHRQRRIDWCLGLTHCQYTTGLTGVIKERKKSGNYSKTMNFGNVKMKRKISDNDLKKHDQFIYKQMAFEKLYNWQQENHDLKKEFVLHDGPPYANGHLHMGHAVNKVLKDVIARHKLLTGHKVHLIPGWDCHGLPIELKAGHTEGDQDSNVVKIRKKARAYATKMLEIQKKEFNTLGLMVDWKNIYRTYDKSYVTSQLRLFYQLYEAGYIFQDFLPVNLSPSSGTVLAEAEIEHLDYTSPTVYAAFPVVQMSSSLQKIVDSFTGLPLYLPIWTSKPWTLPMNALVACSPMLQYLVIKTSSQDRDVLLIWSKDLLKNLTDFVKGYKVVAEVPGSELVSTTYKRPLQDSVGRLESAEFVTAKRGSGLVHLSPAHGHDDFHFAKRLGLDVVNMVNIHGRYKDEMNWDLAGKQVLGEGDEAVIKLLETNEDSSTLLLHKDTMVHSHPHDWRKKTPLITSALSQWFFDISKIKEKCLSIIQDIPLSHESMKKFMMDNIKNRNYWCISRQRVWGVPIPVFYNAQTGKHIINKEINDHILELIDKNGPDIWWTSSTEELLPPSVVDEYKSSNQLLPVKGTDILDIWFDSGSSWNCVLKGNKIADLYLEGVDQLTAWFQTSLFLSVAARERAPYSSLYVHGFVVDKENRKMSKSLGNVTTPLQLMYGEEWGEGNNKKIKNKKSKDLNNNTTDPLGIDALRLWICWSASPDIMSIKDVNKMKTRVSKIRMTMKFLLSLVHDYNTNEVPVFLPLQEMQLIDRYILHRLLDVYNEVEENYQSFQFGKGCRVFYEFIEDLSEVYLNIIKDRMHCHTSTDKARQSGRTAVDYLIYYLLHCLAPVIPHLAEEVAMHHPYKQNTFNGVEYMETESNSENVQNNSVFRRSLEPIPLAWNQPHLFTTINQILDLRKTLHTTQGWSGKKGEGYKYGVMLNLSSDIAHILQDLHPNQENLHSDLCEILEVSEVIFNHSSENEIILEVYPSRRELCLRCWKLTADSNDELCTRCKDAVEMYNMQF